MTDPTDPTVTEDEAPDPGLPLGPPPDAGLPGGVLMEGVIVYPLPATYTTDRRTVSGEEVVFLWVATPGGGVGTFWPLPDARRLGQAILDAAGGIQIASTIPGDVPPGLIAPGGAQ